MKIWLLSLFILLAAAKAMAQFGCTDVQALNYNAGAAINDGSCIYPSTTIAISIQSQLVSPALDECSGLCYVNGKLWTHVDNGISTLYCIDSITGTIIDSVTINAVNSDWEDLAVSNDYLFIGDFGNNWGNRTNLKILKIPKAALDTSNVITPEVINFNYSDQISFTTALNNNSFDCEAFFFFNDSLHLFTKDWISKLTKHYVIPSVAGNYSLTPVDSFNVNGLVTSAAISADSIIVLTCYNSTSSLPVFMWMFFDYQTGNYFSGNKRRFEMGTLTSTGQVEGVDFIGSHNGYLSSERFQYISINVPPRIQSFNLNPYLPFVTGIMHNDHNAIKLYPNPASGYIYIDSAFKGCIVSIKDYCGRTILSLPFDGEKVDIHSLQNGFYIITIPGHGSFSLIVSG